VEQRSNARKQATMDRVWKNGDRSFFRENWRWLWISLIFNKARSN